MSFFGVDSIHTLLNRVQRDTGTAMRHLSSGKKTGYGDRSAEMGIAASLKAKISSLGAARENIRNARALYATLEDQAKQVTDILSRMSELAISAADSSKNQQDRVNIQQEFGALKDEIIRVSDGVNYNGLQRTTADAVAVWDNTDNRVHLSDTTGGIGTILQSRNQDLVMSHSARASNGLLYAFESSANGKIGDFILSKDGKSLLYVAQQTIASQSTFAGRSIMKLDLPTNTMTQINLDDGGGVAENDQTRLILDEEGRIWVGNPQATTGSDFRIDRLDLDTFTLVNETNDATTASGFNTFQIHKDRMYYMETVNVSGFQYVSQNISDLQDKQILLTHSTLDTVMGMDRGDTYAISKDGQFIAFEDETTATTGVDQELVVVNALERTFQKADVGEIGDKTNIVGLAFDNNNYLYWSDTGDTSARNALLRLRVSTENVGGIGQVKLGSVETIQNNKVGEVGAANQTTASANGMGFNIISRPDQNHVYRIGAHSSDVIELVGLNVNLVQLGISDIQIGEINQAIKAHTAIREGIESVSKQLARLGANASRLNFAEVQNMVYKDNLEAARSVLEDTDLARTATDLTQFQILEQTGIAVLAQANVQGQSILRLLQ
ncbi:hypothetical protein AB751O23_BF_00030 [Chlamydiales bacterium SCGC AB-751-O23]|nr:hypothetical protein AB751O23_BF_00030 [Chlamydiales bacterium SCGC AB-751-O23]